MIKRWQEALKNPLFTREVPTFSIICFIMLYNSPWWMNIVENQPGAILIDPILDYIPSYDFSIYIMSIIYGTVFVSFAWLILFPMRMHLAIKTFWLVVTLRYLLIYLIPLEPHPSIILLHDPFLAMIVYDSNAITKDLFFSGHMMTMCIACFVTSYKPLKYIVILLTVLLGTMLMIQHVHYSYDVLAAPIITWGGYRVAQLNILVKPFMQNSNTSFSKDVVYEGKMPITASRKEM